MWVLGTAVSASPATPGVAHGGPGGCGGDGVEGTHRGGHGGNGGRGGSVHLNAARASMLVDPVAHAKVLAFLRRPGWVDVPAEDYRSVAWSHRLMATPLSLSSCHGANGNSGGDGSTTTGGAGANGALGAYCAAGSAGTVAPSAVGGAGGNGGTGGNATCSPGTGGHGGAGGRVETPQAVWVDSVGQEGTVAGRRPAEAERVALEVKGEMPPEGQAAPAATAETASERRVETVGREATGVMQPRGRVGTGVLAEMAVHLAAVEPEARPEARSGELEGVDGKPGAEPGESREERAARRGMPQEQRQDGRARTARSVRIELLDFTGPTAADHGIARLVGRWLVPRDRSLRWEGGPVR